MHSSVLYGRQIDRCIAFLRSNATTTIIVIIGTIIALAALILQAEANNMNKVSNRLAHEANLAADRSYTLQLWDDCHDEAVSALTESRTFRNTDLSLRKQLCFNA